MRTFIALELPFPAQSRAHAATLFKSTLSREGARYKPLYSVELRETCQK